MKTYRRQTGLSIPGILAIMIMVGFFLMCAIRMSPPYFESLSVRDIISRIVMEPDAGTGSIRQIRRKIENIFNSNQIYELQPKDVDIYRKKGKTYVDARYEVRLPIMGRIDAVLKFDDLLYVVGTPTPIAATPATTPTIIK
jgi:hypothetical protein